MDTTRTRLRPWLVAVVVVGVVAVLVAAVWAWIAVPALYPVPVSSVDQAVDATREATRSQAIVTTRASVLAALAGLGALVTIGINYRNSAIATRNAEVAAETLATTNRTFQIAARGHLTDRYTKAIEQLGTTGTDGSLAIRLGGIYGLRQFAVESDRTEDQTTVVEVLSAFVRTHLPRIGDERPPETGGQPVEPEPDVLAAVSALAQLPDRIDLRGDFSGVDFTTVQLTQARLLSANLRGVWLASAVLVDADLSGARLIGADLSGANLRDAVLVGARLSDADLSGADLSGADLSRADLSGADLRGAHLSGADLDRAILRGADLSQADLHDARLGDADLSGADLSGADLSRADLSGAELRGAVLLDTVLRGTVLRHALLDPHQLSAEQRQAVGLNGPAAT